MLPGWVTHHKHKSVFLKDIHNSWVCNFCDMGFNMSCINLTWSFTLSWAVNVTSQALTCLLKLYKVFLQYHELLMLYHRYASWSFTLLWVLTSFIYHGYACCICMHVTQAFIHHGYIHHSYIMDMHLYGHACHTGIYQSWVMYIMDVHMLCMCTPICKFNVPGLHIAGIHISHRCTFTYHVFAQHEHSHIRNRLSLVCKEFLYS